MEILIQEAIAWYNLPLIGDNLAKQMGTAGSDTRTDRMGMLLLISPPGYGKTTLMEYIANRLGITFMKISGPALGHDATSLDLEEATNASAREEAKKLNLALEMGGSGENDPVSRVVGTLASIHETLSNAAAHQMQPATLADVTVEKLAGIIDKLRAVPVEVEIKVVPVHEGEEEVDAPVKKAKKTAAKKKSAKRKVSGKEKGLPVDVEATVEQGE